MRALLLGLAVLPLSTPLDDRFDEALAAFRHAAARPDMTARAAALDSLLELADPQATRGVLSAYVTCLGRIQDAQAEEQRQAYALRDRDRVLSDLRLRVERDPSLEVVISRLEQGRDRLARSLERSRKVVTDSTPWRELLMERTRSFLGALPASKRRSAVKTLWDAIEEPTDPFHVTAALDFLGRVGGDGTAVDTQKFLTTIAAERAKILRKLPKKEAEVRKIEARLQKEAEQSGGGMGRGSMAQYQRAKREAAADRSALTHLAAVIDACAQAGATALAREEGEVQTKSIQALGRALSKAKEGARLPTLRMLATVPCEPAQAFLRDALARERDAAAIAATIESLALIGDQAIVPELLGKWLDHEDWVVRAAALRALAHLRVREAIPALIERLGTSQGRDTTDLREGLCSLTARDFRANAELWQRWWRDEGQEFQVPSLEEVERAADDAERSVGVTFFGISTTSQRVIFIVDLSGSMEFSMVPRNNPNDDPNRPFDLPRGSEISRLTALKRDLLRVLGELDDGALMNLVLYASDVWTWQDKLVEMDEKKREAVLEYVDSLRAVGGTNIYGALREALDLAGAKGGGKWSEPLVDTFFLLTDGRPSVGVTTNADEILEFVRERNASAGIVIHTIGLSGAQDAYLLRNLAEQNGGTYAAH